MGAFKRMTDINNDIAIRYDDIRQIDKRLIFATILLLFYVNLL